MFWWHKMGLLYVSVAQYRDTFVFFFFFSLSLGSCYSWNNRMHFSWPDWKNWTTLWVTLFLYVKFMLIFHMMSVSDSMFVYAGHISWNLLLIILLLLLLMLLYISENYSFLLSSSNCSLILSLDCNCCYDHFCHQDRMVWKSTASSLDSMGQRFSTFLPLWNPLSIVLSLQSTCIKVLSTTHLLL